MKKSKVSIEDTGREILTSEAATLEGAIAKGEIAWKNSKGERRSVPWSRVNRLGGFVGDKDTDAQAFEVFLAMTFKLQSEQKAGAKSENGTIAVRAGHSVKMGTCSASLRVSKIEAKKAEVSCQLAAAQKAHKRVADIKAELERRDAAEKAQAEAAKKAATDAEQAAALMPKAA